MEGWSGSFSGEAQHGDVSKNICLFSLSTAVALLYFLSFSLFLIDELRRFLLIFWGLCRISGNLSSSVDLTTAERPSQCFFVCVFVFFSSP